MDSHDVPPDALKTIRQTLQALNTAKRAQKSVWGAACLVKRYLGQHPGTTSYRAIRAVFAEILEDLRREFPGYADLLQGRFWDGYSPGRMVSEKRPRDVQERRFRQLQQEAITQFALLLWQREQICKEEQERAFEAESIEGVQSLHQLPSPLADFTGRTDELRAIDIDRAQRGIHIYGLRGMGGIGKTSLALVVAHILIPHYPDAQFYIDLRGTSLQPLTTTQAMMQVIRAYHPTARLPEMDTELAALYRSVLYGKHAILAFDNAASAEQIAPLMQPATCAIIITSRNHFTVPGLFRLDLDTMPMPDACALLLKIEPRIEDHAQTIAKLCGCLPLALRVAASTLVSHKDLSPVEYTARLADTRHRLELVEATFQLSFDLLSAEQQVHWGMLAVFPGTFDLAAAAAVLERDRDGAHDVLSTLVARSLVDWNESTRRYHLHDLARLFVWEVTPENLRWSAGQRHAAHFSAVLAQANNLYQAGSDAVIRGLRLFDVDWHNIRAGQTWAATHSMDNDDAAGLCIAYALMGAALLLIRLHARERVVWRENGLQANNRLNDRSAEAGLYRQLSRDYTVLNEYSRAIENAERALSIAREIGDLFEEGAARSVMGTAYKDLGELPRAIKSYQTALTLLSQLPDARARRTASAALGNLGNAFSHQGDPQRAIEYYQQQRALAQELGDRRQEGNVLNNMGLAYADLAQVRRAFQLYQEALPIRRELGDQQGEADTLNNLGLIHAHLGEYDQALTLYEQARVIYRAIGNRRGESNAIGNIGLAYVELNQLDRAMDYLEQQLATARDIGYRRGEGNALKDMGYVLCRLGEHQRALVLLEQARTIFEKTGDQIGLGRALGGVGDAYYELGDLQRAETYYNQHYELALQTGDQQAEGFALRRKAWVLKRVGQEAAAEEHLQRAMALLNQIADIKTEEIRVELAQWQVDSSHTHAEHDTRNH